MSVVRRGVLLAVLLAAALSLLGAPGPAYAHQPGSTLLTMAAVGSGLGGDPALRLRADVPLDQLDFAYGTALAADPEGEVARQRERLEQLVADRVHLSDPDGAAWTSQVASIGAGRRHGRDVLEIVVLASPPSSTAPDLVELRWDVVTDAVYSHKVYVGGQDAEEQTQYLGILGHSAPFLELRVEAPAGHVAASSMLGVGFDHFREGADHLLFLCLVGLGAARRRSAPRATLVRLAGPTVTFTVGHSVSLALATLGWVDLPSRWVETAIAATILLTAVHVVRPVLSSRAEVLATGAFGLVHGFGFAGTLADLRVTPTDLVAPCSPSTSASSWPRWPPWRWSPSSCGQSRGPRS